MPAPPPCRHPRRCIPPPFFFRLRFAALPLLPVQIYVSYFSHKQRGMRATRAPYWPHTHTHTNNHMQLHDALLCASKVRQQRRYRGLGHTLVHETGMMGREEKGREGGSAPYTHTHAVCHARTVPAHALRGAAHPTTSAVPAPVKMARRALPRRLPLPRVVFPHAAAAAPL